MALCSPSRRLASVPASPIRKLVPYALQAKKEGVKVYHLNIGDPDIKTPEVMLKTLSTLDLNPIGYDQSPGNPDFLKSLIWYYHKIGFPFLTEKTLQVTLGGSEAIAMAFFATCDPGEEILVFEPFYTNYNSFAALYGIQLTPILTKPENGFHLPEAGIIEAAITPKTKAIFICNPNNPTGTVYTKEEIQRLVDIAKKYNLYLISDEVYREFVYDGGQQISLLSYIQELPQQIIVLDSTSKRYSLCGARLGVLLSLNEEIMAGVLRIAQGRLSAGIIDQKIATKLTEVPEEYFLAVREEYQQRRDILYSGLKNIPGVSLTCPEGAFYAMATLPLEDAEDFCKWLLTDFRLNNETVMLAPAAGFYATPGLGKNQVRLAYVINGEDIKKALTILEKAIPAYKSSLAK